MAEERPEYCPRCGVKTPDSGAYCPECGADLLAYTEADTDTDASSDADGSMDRRPDVTGGPDQSAGPSRRQYLLGGGLVGAVAVGGGFVAWQQLQEGEEKENEKPIHRLYGEGWDLEDTTGQQSIRQEGTVRLPKGAYASLTFHPQTGTRYSVEFAVLDGHPIDLFVMDDDEYDRYRDRDRDTQYLTELSSIRSVEDSVRGALSPGEYHFVFDNTGVFGADPQEKVTVEISITARLL